MDKIKTDGRSLPIRNPLSNGHTPRVIRALWFLKTPASLRAIPLDSCKASTFRISGREIRDRAWPVDL